MNSLPSEEEWKWCYFYNKCNDMEAETMKKITQFGVVSIQLCTENITERNDFIELVLLCIFKTKNNFWGVGKGKVSSFPSLF